MHRSLFVGLGLALALGLAGCSQSGPNKSDAGLAIGAITGGLIGNSVGRGRGRVAATAIGAVVGGIVGSEIGRSLDERDRQLAQRAEFDALERGGSGVAIPWRNRDSGRYGEVIPDRPYRSRGSYCRVYTHRIFIDGRPQTMRGTACRNPDGTWRKVT
ncbi:MAG: RT0821/Lpp0805 family surface protein [Pseudomonadota bacterium]